MRLCILPAKLHKGVLLTAIHDGMAPCCLPGLFCSKMTTRSSKLLISPNNNASVKGHDPQGCPVNLRKKFCRPGRINFIEEAVSSAGTLPSGAAQVLWSTQILWKVGVLGETARQLKRWPRTQ